VPSVLARYSGPLFLALYFWGTPRDGAVSGALLIEGLLRPAGSPVLGVFCDELLFLLPLASVFGLLGWPSLDRSVRVGSVLVVLPD